MNVLMISPGYPMEMEQFAAGLARVGAKVYGIGDSAQSSLPRMAHEALSGYLEADLKNDWPAMQHGHGSFLVTRALD